MFGSLHRPKVSKGTKAKKKRSEGRNVKTNIKYHPRKYDVTTELSKYLSGLTVEQIFRVWAMEEKKELSSLFTARSGKKLNVLGTESSSGLRVLIYEVKIFGIRTHAWIDSVSVT